MSAANRAAARGLSHVLLEKTDHLSDTIYRYQKGKHVMATPVSLTLRSDCSFDAGKREAILQNWNEQTGKAKANVRYKAEVKSVTGAKGDFTITLTSGDTIKAETIIMANIHASCLEYGKTGEGKYVDYTKGTNIAGFKKVADAMLAYGVV
jgi:cGMP-dependent protein kinase 2